MVHETNSPRGMVAFTATEVSTARQGLEVAEALEGEQECRVFSLAGRKFVSSRQESDRLERELGLQPSFYSIHRATGRLVCTPGRNG